MAATPTRSGVRPDTWLSEVLARPVFGVEGEPPADAAAGFYYTKVEVADVTRAHRFCDAGFAPVDVNVVLAREPERAPAATAGASVVPARPEHRDALLEVAGSCFRYSRFHLDPQIDDEAAHRVKREWVRSYFDGRRGSELLAALDGDRPVGFLAVLDADGARVIDLVGVAVEAQGRGVGSALVAEFVRRSAGAAQLRVGTQLANLPSLRLYENFGFGVARAAYVLHRHV